MDSYGNYQANLNYTSDSLGGSMGGVWIISGVPDANTPSWYTVVVNSSTGNIYAYYNSQWNLIGSGGGGGTTQVFSGNGVPSGAPSGGATNAIYIQLDSAPAYQLWTYTTPGGWN